MREAYNMNILQKEQMKQRCKEHIKQFSYAKIGDIINARLD
jgi:hypothetical protein